MNPSSPAVAILYGGRSSEHEVSIRSALAIVTNLDRTRFNPLLMGVDREGGFRVLPTFETEGLPPDEEGLKKALRRVLDEGERLSLIPGDPRPFRTSGGHVIPVDLAFSVLHGSYGEDGRMQGLFDILNLPFVGPDIAGSVLGMDKEVMKRLLMQAGIPSARYLVLRKDSPGNVDYAQASRTLGKTLFIKPARQGSSVGVHRVSSPEEWEKALEDAFRFDLKLLVEEAIRGREIECAVLGNEKLRVSPPGEIIPEHSFYSYEAKYLDDKGARLEIPASVSIEQSAMIREVAEKTFRTLLCEGMTRVDVFLTEDDRVLVNEINTLPGFTEISMYPKLMVQTGISFPELITELLELALERKKRNDRIVTRL